VIDFFDFVVNGHHFPAFNIADSCITIGVALMVADLFSWKSPPDSSAKII
jgi:signal peptidase II